MTDLKHLVSPFTLVPFTATAAAKKVVPRPAPPCNCDSDEENDFGMAPECAFVCNNPTVTHKKSKKRGIKHVKPRTKQTRKKMMHEYRI